MIEFQTSVAKVSVDFKDKINILLGDSGVGKSLLLKLLAVYFREHNIPFEFKSFIDKSFGNVPHSIETFYKALLNTSKYICTRNIKSVKNIGTGTFYRTDCACTQYCRSLCKKSLREKSDLLVSYLPAYPTSGELRESLRKQGRSSISISLEEFHQLQKLLYDKMSSDLGLKMKLKI